MTRCPHCQSPVVGRFCPSCGREVAPPARSAAGPWLWMGGGLVLLVVFGLGVLVGRGHGGAAPAEEGPVAAAAPSGGAVAPDISNMSPRERFDRLFNRVMQASQNGDIATMQQFAPMAISAYGMLDSTDIDAQYDVALIKLHTGDMPGAKLLADSIVKKSPTHLFGQMLRASIARSAGDSAAARAAQAAFLRNYPEEMRKGRPEYDAHRTSIDAFKQQLGRTS